MIKTELEGLIEVKNTGIRCEYDMLFPQEIKEKKHIFRERIRGPSPYNRQRGMIKLACINFLYH